MPNESGKFLSIFNSQTPSDAGDIVIGGILPLLLSITSLFEERLKKILRPAVFNDDASYDFCNIPPHPR